MAFDAKYSKLGDIIFSVTNPEDININNDVTQYPLEDGSNITDNIHIMPRTITISGIVVGDDAPDKLAILRKYLENKTILPYVGRNIFNNVVIQAMTTTHDKDILNGFKFNITLQQITIAYQETILIDFSKVPQPKIWKKQKAGKKALEEVESPDGFDELEFDVNEELYP